MNVYTGFFVSVLIHGAMLCIPLARFKGPIEETGRFIPRIQQRATEVALHRFLPVSGPAGPARPARPARPDRGSLSFPKAVEAVRPARRELVEPVAPGGPDTVVRLKSVPATGISGVGAQAVEPLQEVPMPLSALALGILPEETPQGVQTFANGEVMAMGDSNGSVGPAAETADHIGHTGARVAARTGTGGDSVQSPLEGTPGLSDREARWIDYFAQFRQIVEAARVYPVRMRRMGIEGTAVVRVVVGEKGEVREVALAEPSPAAILNQAALDFLRSLPPLPPLPPALGDRIEITIPMVYRLEAS